ncbi:MAG: GC-type dockerin domain-anchored protein, partial [Planctomycetota bacterium]
AEIFGEPVGGQVESFVVSSTDRGVALTTVHNTGYLDVYVAWELRDGAFVQIDQTLTQSRGVQHLGLTITLDAIESAFGHTVWRRRFGSLQARLSGQHPATSFDGEAVPLYADYFRFEDGSRGLFNQSTWSITENGLWWAEDGTSLVLSDLSAPDGPTPIRIMLTGNRFLPQTAFDFNGVPTVLRINGLNGILSTSNSAALISGRVAPVDDPDANLGAILRVSPDGSVDQVSDLVELGAEWAGAGFSTGNLRGQSLIETSNQIPGGGGRAIYALDDRGTRYEAIRTGDSLDVNGVPRTVTSLRLNSPYNTGPFLSNSGWFVVPVELDGTTQAFAIGKVPGPCPADVNEDGVLSPADFSAWTSHFTAQSPAADLNFDGRVTPADLYAWILEYSRGCDS